jgi:hypothetical protein
MTNVDNAMPLELDPISAQIIRQYLIQSIERIDDEDIISEEETEEDEDE